MKTLLRSALAFLVVFSSGCSSTQSTVDTRRNEKAAAYAALSAEQRTLVDEGQIKVGMSEDAVYIAWGEPAQRLLNEDANGRTTTWLYHGTTTDEYVGWRYYSVPGPNGSHLSRRLDRDFNVREYVSAELNFRDGKLETWRTLAKPGGNTIYAP